MFINRSERQYTAALSTLLQLYPERAIAFFRKAGVPETIISKTHSFRVELELSLKKLKLTNGQKPYTMPGDVPDLVFILYDENYFSIFLLIVECKMFTIPTMGEVLRQIEAQAIYKGVLGNLINCKNCHQAFISMGNFEIPNYPNLTIVNWEQVIRCFPRSEDQAYRDIEKAIKRPDLATPRASTFRKNCHARWKGEKIIDKIKCGEKFFIGRKGGAHQILKDYNSGEFWGRKYEINRKNLPNGTNWMSSTQIELGE